MLRATQHVHTHTHTLHSNYWNIVKMTRGGDMFSGHGSSTRMYLAAGVAFRTLRLEGKSPVSWLYISPLVVHLRQGEIVLLWSINDILSWQSETHIKGCNGPSSESITFHLTIYDYPSSLTFRRLINLFVYSLSMTCGIGNTVCIKFHETLALWETAAVYCG